MKPYIKLDFIIKVSFTLGIFQICIALLQSLSPGFKDFTYIIFTNYEKYIEVNRVVGTIGNPNHLGIFTTIVFMLIINYIYHKGIINPFYHVLLIFVFFVPIYLGGSKTALIVYSVVCLSSLFLSNISKISKSILFVVFSCLFIYVYYLFVELTGRNLDFHRMSGRIGIWENLISEFNNADLFTKIFGFGIQMKEVTTDNYYLQILLTSGIYGILVYIFLLIYWIYFSKKIKIRVNKIIFLNLLLLLIITDYTAITSLSQKTSFIIFFLIGYLLTELKTEKLHEKPV